MISLNIIIVSTMMLAGCSAFPQVDYTGYDCKAKDQIVSHFCQVDSAAIFTKPAVTNQAPRAVFFIGENVDISCCTPPASPYTSIDIIRTLQYRQLSYLLHDIARSPLYVVQSGKVCWDESAEDENQDLCQLYPGLQAIRQYISADNSHCEFFTMRLRPITLNETGIWQCGTSLVGGSSVHLPVAVGQPGQLQCTANQMEIGTGLSSHLVDCHYADHSPKTAIFHWVIQVGMESILPFGPVGVITSPYFMSGSGLGALDNKEIRCMSFTSVYDQSATSSSSSPLMPPSHAAAYPTQEQYCRYNSRQNLSLLVNCSQPATNYTYFTVILHVLLEYRLTYNFTHTFVLTCPDHTPKNNFPKWIHAIVFIFLATSTLATIVVIFLCIYIRGKSAFSRSSSSNRKEAAAEAAAEAKTEAATALL